MKNLTNKILLTVIVLLLLMMGSLWLSKQASSKRFAEALRIESQKAELWRDKAGRSHAEIERLQLTNKQLRDAKPALIDSIRKDFTNINPRTITKVVTITNQIRDTIPFPVSNPLAFHYKDRWKTLSIGADSTLRLEVRDSIALVDSRKRYGFLKLKTKHTIEAVNYNPDATITGLKSIDIVAPPPKRIGIGIMAGYGVTNSGLSPFLGAGVYYRIW